MRRLTIVTATLLSLLCGCGRDIKNKEAVKQGVIDWLNKRQSQTSLNLDQMDIEVTSVAFQKSEAHATVSFKVKGADASGSMSKNYVLQQRGDKWVVSGSQESGLNPHGGAMPNMPPDHPPVEGAKP